MPAAVAPWVGGADPRSKRFPDLRPTLELLFRDWERGITKPGNPRRIAVIVEGIGDAFHHRYAQTLCEYVDRGIVDLTLVDQRAKPAWLGPLLHRVHPQVSYINKSDPDQESAYRALKATHPDLVFVLVPDHAHISLARDWLGQAAIIVIEKPYDENAYTAATFQNELHQWPHTLVLPIDHYLARLYSLLAEKYIGGQSLIQHLCTRIGPIRSIDFDILEHDPIETGREQSLNSGLIYVLFSHVLAVVLAIVRPSIENEVAEFNLTAQLTKVQRASYTIDGHKPLPSGKETFGYVDMTIMNHVSGPKEKIRLSSAVGKGVAGSAYSHTADDTKFLRIEGDLGVLEIDFTGNVHVEIDSTGTEHRKIGLRRILASYADPRPYPLPADSGLYDPPNVTSGHREMLHSLLQGKYLVNPIGAMSRPRALWILDRLYEVAIARTSHGDGSVDSQIPTYPLVRSGRGKYTGRTKEELLNL